MLMLSCLLLSWPSPSVSLQGYDHSTHYNLRTTVRLKDVENYVPDGGTLSMPITARPEYISVRSAGPPKIVDVDSVEDDLEYGVGQELYIDVKFTSPVDVSGSPRLVMSTGCGGEAGCYVKEVQQFTCLADEGKFSITFKRRSSDTGYEAQHATNIPVSHSQEQLKQTLEQLEGVRKVTVKYDDVDDRDYSFGNRVCTSKGNKVTITFDEVDDDVGDDGDIPQIILDKINAPLDPRTYLNLGDGTFLRAQVKKKKKIYLSEYI